jgi:hypothetical protein
MKEVIMARHNKITRREFLHRTAFATAALGLTPELILAKSTTDYDAKGLPTRKLGSTGVKVPPVALGTGSRYCAVQDESTGLKILEYALNNGFYYWDTASSYGSGDVISEARLGKILKHRRNEVFLATKVHSREPEEARRLIEQSLDRLQTDYLDILQIHSVNSVEDVEQFTKPGGVYDLVREMKAEGITRFIGFTGHTSAEAMKYAAANFEFDTMLIALNHMKDGKQKFEQDAIPAALEKGMGVMAMKVVRPRETVSSVTIPQLIKYGLSLTDVSACVLGTDSVDVVKSNLNLVKNFTPLKQDQMEEIKTALAPFYRHENLPWMAPHYRDGNWA